MKNSTSELERRIKEQVAPHKGKPIALSGGIDSSLLAALVKPKFAISVQLPGGSRYNEVQWARKVTKHLNIEHIVIRTDSSKFDEYTRRAVKAIGRPIPHFNIFPLYVMYKHLASMGETEVILGDGPDETMAGYARDIIIDYLYKIYEFEAFQEYKELIGRILPSKLQAIERTTGLQGFNTVLAANIEKRKEMDDMSDGIARSFGIKNIRPYQDSQELDDFIKNLPMEEKIHGEFGKYALRKIAAKYLPKSVAWRKKKMGGPVYPVNKVKGWMEDGEFGKKRWLQYQKEILQ